MSRLYVVESCYTITGAMADHRLALRNSKLPPSWSGWPAGIVA